MLNRLMNEIDVLYCNEARYGIPVRMTVAALIIDYFDSFGLPEPPIPTYPAYVWPEGLQTFE